MCESRTAVVFDLVCCFSNVSSLFIPKHPREPVVTKQGTLDVAKKKKEKGICHIRTYESTLSPYGVTAGGRNKRLRVGKMNNRYIKGRKNQQPRQRIQH